METQNSNAKKMVAGAVVAVLLVGGATVFWLRRKKSDQAAANLHLAMSKIPANQAKTTLRANADNVTDVGNNRLQMEIGGRKVFISKNDTGTRFSAAPELLAKLTEKYGAGALYQKGKQISEGFEWRKSTGGVQELSFKDFVAMSKPPSNDEGSADIGYSSFYNCA